VRVKPFASSATKSGNRPRRISVFRICSRFCYFNGVQKLNNSGRLKQLAITCANELSELAKPDLYYSLKESPYKAG
jgi:hypothetical protein